VQGGTLPRDFCPNNELKDKFDAIVRRKTGEATLSFFGCLPLCIDVSV
jgi:hypothetical protein